MTTTTDSGPAGAGDEVRLECFALKYVEGGTEPQSAAGKTSTELRRRCGDEVLPTRRLYNHITTFIATITDDEADENQTHTNGQQKEDVENIRN